MQHRAINANTPYEHLTKDPAQKIHRQLAWALGTATGALIINAVAVVALVEGG